jgi:hypothetical protein
MNFLSQRLFSILLQGYKAREVFLYEILKKKQAKPPLNLLNSG